MKSPSLYIIAGCNGAGKTTASFTLLPDVLDCQQFVNADEIAKGLSPFHPESVSMEAGRIMLGRIEELLHKGITFAIETTLAPRSYHHGIDNLFNLFMPIVDSWTIIDNTRCRPRVVANETLTLAPEIYERIKNDGKTQED